MSERMTDSGAARDSQATSTISGRDNQLDVLTRITIGLIRQIAHDAGGDTHTTIEQVGFAPNSLSERVQIAERVAERGRAIVRKEFVTDADAKRYALKWSVLVDDLVDHSGKQGDIEVTVHPIDASRFQEIVTPR